MYPVRPVTVTAHPLAHPGPAHLTSECSGQPWVSKMTTSGVSDGCFLRNLLPHYIHLQTFREFPEAVGVRIFHDYCQACSNRFIESLGQGLLQSSSDQLVPCFARAPPAVTLPCPALSCTYNNAAVFNACTRTCTYHPDCAKKNALGRSPLTAVSVHH